MMAPPGPRPITATRFTVIFAILGAKHELRESRNRLQNYFGLYISRRENGSMKIDKRARCVSQHDFSSTAQRRRHRVLRFRLFLVNRMASTCIGAPIIPKADSPICDMRWANGVIALISMLSSLDPLR